MKKFLLCALFCLALVLGVFGITETGKVFAEGTQETQENVIEETEDSSYFTETIQPILLSSITALTTICGVLTLASKFIKKLTGGVNNSVVELKKENEQLKAEFKEFNKTAKEVVKMRAELQKLQDDIKITREVSICAALNSPDLVANGTASEIAKMVGKDGIIEEKKENA